LTYLRGFSWAQGLKQLWCNDTLDKIFAESYGYNTIQTYIVNKPTVKESFSVAIPLSYVLGFEDDNDKVVYVCKHLLILRRALDNDAIILDGGAATYKVELSRIQWMMPHVATYDFEKLAFFKIIEAKENISVAFKSRRC
jgi:hypothetical protein